MAEIKPFKGMRYNTRLAGKINQLCCPPYDIISEEERLEYIAENEYNVIRLELPREGEDVYKNAGDILDLILRALLESFPRTASESCDRGL